MCLCEGVCVRESVCVCVRVYVCEGACVSVDVYSFLLLVCALPRVCEAFVVCMLSIHDPHPSRSSHSQQQQQVLLS